MVTQRDLENAKKVYKYMQLHEPVKKCDLILGLGCSDENVARRAAELFLLGYGDCIIFSGGAGKITSNWEWETEAEHFKEIAIGMGVSEFAIFTENSSTNIGENFQYTDDLIHSANIPAKSILVVTKTSAERRVRAAFEKQMPYYSGIITSPNTSFEDNLIYYYCHEIPCKDVISLMIGDLQRLYVYYQKGYQSRVDVPVEMMQIFTEMVQNGYGKYTV